MAKREIYIIRNDAYDQLVGELGDKGAQLNSWNCFSFDERRKTININGNTIKVEFARDSISNSDWYVITKANTESICLEKYDDANERILQGDFDCHCTEPGDCD